MMIKGFLVGCIALIVQMVSCVAEASVGGNLYIAGFTQNGWDSQATLWVAPTSNPTNIKKFILDTDGSVALAVAVSSNVIYAVGYSNPEGGGIKQRSGRLLRQALQILRKFY